MSYCFMLYRSWSQQYIYHYYNRQFKSPISYSSVKSSVNMLNRLLLH